MKTQTKPGSSNEQQQSNRVSIVMPVYNGANYMREAIDSALAQTYDNIEIIVVNDGSTDNTDEIAKSYGDRIRYFNKKNGGVSTALNLAIKNMTGDYFSWLSHDDTYRPEKVQKQIDYIEQNGAGNYILYANYQLIDQNSKPMNAVIHNHEMLTKKPEYALLRGCINGLSLLIPKDAFDKCGLFDESLSCASDYVLWAKMAETYKFVHMEDVLVATRVHTNRTAVASPDVVSEGNMLWKNMVDNVPIPAMERLEGSKYLFYIEMAKFLKDTPYLEVADYCNEMAEKVKAHIINNVLNQTLVSVIIPFYNRPMETIRAIRSVISQTHKNYEIILIDDASTEDMTQLLTFVQEQKNINVIHLQKNRGPAGARNEGIKKAHGEYIAFLDSDDEFLHDKLQTQLLEMLLTKSVMSHTSYIRRMNSEDSVINAGQDTGYVSRKLMYSCQIATPTVMLNRAFITSNNLSYNENMRIGEDVCFWLSILKDKPLLGLTKALSRVNANESSSAYDDSRQIEGLKTILTFLLNDSHYSKFDFEIANLAQSYVNYVRRKQEMERGYVSEENASLKTIKLVSPHNYPIRFIRSVKRHGFMGFLKIFRQKLKAKLKKSKA